MLDGLSGVAPCVAPGQSRIKGKIDQVCVSNSDPEPAPAERTNVVDIGGQAGGIDDTPLLHLIDERCGDLEPLGRLAALDPDGSAQTRLARTDC